MAVPHEAQEAEARARAESGVDPAQNVTAMDTVDADGQRADPGPAQPPQQQAQPPQPERKPPSVRSPFDEKRAAILDRFRTQRQELEQEARDDISDFQRSGMPPEFEAFKPQEPGVETTPAQQAQEPEPQETQPESQPAAPAEPPRTVKIKVNGQEREVPLEEAINKAQIAYASENILDEAKALRRELQDMKNQPQRQGPGHQAGQPPQPGYHAAPQQTQPAPGQPTEQQPPQPDPDQDELNKLYEAWSFGDPAEAQSRLRDTIDRRVTRAVNEAVDQIVTQRLVEDRLKDEGSRAAKQLTDFQQAHPDIAKDPQARAVIEYNMYELQLADLREAGIDPAQLPTADGLVRPADIAQAHRWFRAQGLNLKSPKEMLEQATEAYVTWRGAGANNQPQPTPQPAPAPQRVVVSDDRAARREALQQQPSRPAAPRPVPAPPPGALRDRSEIVREEMARRNRPRGRAVV